MIPAVVDRTGTLVTGAAVVEAARKLGWIDFPVIRITHLDDHQLRFFRIAHSKLAEGASWNEEALCLEFEEIAIERPDLTNGVLDACDELGIGLVPHSPLGKGFLTGAIDKDAKLDQGDFRATTPRFSPEGLAANQAFVDLLKQVAETKGATPAQVALAWLMA